MKKVINKKSNYRINILIIFLFFLNFILIVNLYKVQIIDYEKYLTKKELLDKQVIEGNTAPRGRIYDRNGNLLVDNIPIKTITYNKLSGISIEDELKIANKLSKVLSFNIDVDSEILKKYYIVTRKDEVNNKITSDEWDELKSKKITIDEINKLKLERISNEELDTLTEEEKIVAYIYYLMNQGYYYDTKIIKKGDEITDLEYSYISEHLEEFSGINTSVDWQRFYPYDNTFRTILGNVSNNVPSELKNYFLTQGYRLNDRVGISYLEYQYDNYLKGSKDIYNKNNMELIENGRRGNDIYLTIDINLQKEVEKILEEQLIITKNEPNTEFYNRSFVIITNPNTGEILAMSGKQIINNKIIDYTPGILTSPVAVGSVVKIASHIVGYNTGALKIGEVRDDSCIKILATPKKCSWTYLGYVNDLTALQYSSNTYQFRTAINVGGANYTYDGPLKINEEAFDIYRNTFNEFGLGVKTEIDLPKESVGYIGSDKKAGLLLDFSIGQYDTYTPIQLSQYISTVANGGNRLKLFLLKNVHSSIDDSIIYETVPTILNEVNTNQEYMNRVKDGLKLVMSSGTGYGYIDSVYNPAGKTGTSQSFVDSNLDGKIDKETLTNTFIAYAPYDNPIVTFTVISPDYTHYYNSTSYQSMVNKRITYEVSKKFFEIYK